MRKVLQLNSTVCQPDDVRVSGRPVEVWAPATRRGEPILIGVSFSGGAQTDGGGHPRRKYPTPSRRRLLLRLCNSLLIVLLLHQHLVFTNNPYSFLIKKVVPNMGRISITKCILLGMHWRRCLPRGWAEIYQFFFLRIVIRNVWIVEKKQFKTKFVWLCACLSLTIRTRMITKECNVVESSFWWQNVLGFFFKQRSY